jgi:hypothetical protein
MTLLFALQLTIPLIFIGWIALWPPRSLLGFWIQLLATAAGLLMIGLTGLWLLPPWWAPYAFGALLLMAMVVGLYRRRPFNARLPFSVWGWAGVVSFMTFASLSLYLAALAIAGRAPPPGKIVDLAFPLETGSYLILNGGYDPSINAHMATLDRSVARYEAWRGQSYAIDIVKISAAGLRSRGIQPARTWRLSDLRSARTGALPRRSSRQR